jgi:peptide methionine sulfoxide reductase msrA/msrB
MLFFSFYFTACSQIKSHSGISDLPKEKSNIGDKKEMSGDTTKYKKAIFASGCFWGTEYYMQKAKGVISTQVGFIGGTKDNPTYKEVCTGKTGHAEACEVTYDPDKTNYEELAKLFFETHDPTQVNRQGPDIGTQYRTEIFYLDDEQKTTAEKLINILKGKGYDVVTKVTPATTFWKAEDYHQNYYENKNGTPYCHVYKKKFD